MQRSIAGQVKSRVTAEIDKKAYIKADIRARYGAVAEVLDEFRSAGVAELGLLTRKRRPQRSEEDTSARTSAMGLPVLVAERPALGERIIVVQALKGLGQSTALKINQEDVVLGNLEERLNDIFRIRAEKVMFVKADEYLPFEDVASVIDMPGTAVGM